MKSFFQHSLSRIVALLLILGVNGESPYRFFDWEITYGTISPLGFPQRGILINGQFPGPTLDCVTNDNVIVNIINKLDEPFLMTWNGIQQRKSSWTDGVLGTNCPIPPKGNWTYRMQTKDQIGTFSYFPSTLIHKAAGGFGAMNVYRRSVIPIPYSEPDGVFTVLVGDWFTTDHKVLQQKLDSGKPFPHPDGVLLNGRSSGTVFTGEAGKTYMFRVSNVGMTLSINFRIQGHRLKLVEVEGAHTLQEVYGSIDVHVGQSVALLVTLNRNVKDYWIVASSRFQEPILTSSAVLHYSGSKKAAAGPLPHGPTTQVGWGVKQARSIRWNLTANAARPNPQGSYHYGTIPTVRQLFFEDKAVHIDGKLRYAVNGISYVNPETPLKLADYYNISGVFTLGSIPDRPTSAPAKLGTSVLSTELHDYIEIVFQNNENVMQSWHLDGHSFWTVGFGAKKWRPNKRKIYNLEDACTRYTVQVFPNSWSAILVGLDNKGMWNLRSAIWPRRYLGQELYVRVWNDERSLYTESDIPDNALKCGKAARF